MGGALPCQERVLLVMLRGVGFVAPSLVLLVLVALRLAPVTLLLPSLGARTVPYVVRVAIVLTLTVGILPVVAGAPVTMAPRWIAIALVRELTVGTALALVIATPFVALDHAGRLLDTLRGAGAAATPSLAGGALVSPLAALLQATGVVVFLAAGGHRGVIRAFAASLALVPPGAWVSTHRLVELAARWTAESLAAALTLGSAGFLAMIAAECVLALALRFSPPLARAGLAVPVRVLVPLAALAAAVGLWTDATRSLAATALSAVTRMAP